MSTHAQERGMGERNDLLWGVIVNNDDICFKHILPRLNQNDIKFLYDVNSETRALIQRSSWKDELKEEAFYVSEMSSISTLEFAWDNMHWGTEDEEGSVMDKVWFCWNVAETNKLELLKWVREVKKCEWDEETINVAAKKGNLEMVKYCVENQCPVDEHVCACAAGGGHLECLHYLHEEAGAPWDEDTAAEAADYGRLHILEYLVERKYNKYTERACMFAAKYGHLDCLKFLHETAKAPWDAEAVRGAYESEHPECLQYLLDNDCPLPERWRYEDGELYYNY